jgi:hypothetical protein
LVKRVAREEFSNGRLEDGVGVARKTILTDYNFNLL